MLKETHMSFGKECEYHMQAKRNGIDLSITDEQKEKIKNSVKNLISCYGESKNKNILYVCTKSTETIMHQISPNIFKMKKYAISNKTDTSKPTAEKYLILS